jgi:hypothetical protein
VDPVPDPLVIEESGSAGNRTQTSGSVARNSETRPQRRLTVAPTFQIRQFCYDSSHDKVCMESPALKALCMLCHI